MGGRAASAEEWGQPMNRYSPCARGGRGSRSRVAVLGGGLCVAGLLWCLAAGTAEAWNTYPGDPRLIYGVGNYGNSPQHYWIDSSATDFATTVNNAMSNWIYTTSYWGITTPIYYTRTYMKSSSRMDIYQSPYVNPWWGKTAWIKGSIVMEPQPYMNYVWGKITLDANLANYWNIRGCIAHEMGHVFGLFHEGIVEQAIMNPTAVNNAWVYRAMPDDLHGVNYLY